MSKLQLMTSYQRHTWRSIALRGKLRPSARRCRKSLAPNLRPAVELFEGRCLLTTDIAATAFYSDGIELQIDYSISGSDAGAFQLALYASANGTTLDQQLQIVSGDSSWGTLGPHTLTDDEVNCACDPHIQSDVDVCPSSPR